MQGHCLFNKHQSIIGKKTVSLVDFAISVAKEIAETVSEEQRQAADANQSVDRLIGRHFLELILNDNGKKMQRSCHVCYANMAKQGVGRHERRNRRKVTVYQCKTCKIALCPEPCMELYHTLKDYSG